MFKFIIAVGLFLFSYTHIFSQNLLANGGFEDENICTEYRVNCAPEAWICTSPSFIFYFKDAKLAHSGEHVMGLLAGHSNSPFKRTYIRSQLLCSMQKGKQYKLELFVWSRHPILDSVGVYFTDYDFLYEKKVYHKINPSVYLADAREKPHHGTTDWQKIVIDYTASGSEAFIALGYFGLNGITGNTGIDKENNFLIFVDDISMIPEDPNEQLCADWIKTRDSIYAQNERHEYLELLIKRNRNLPAVLTRISPTRFPHIDTLTMPDILFATASAQLQSGTNILLDSLIKSILPTGFDSIVVAGHTDNAGSLELNQKLSAGRAHAVANYLREKMLVNKQAITEAFFGYAKPIASNETPEGRQKNRRVELFIYRHR